MFEDLKAQRTQGLAPRERRRLLTMVSVTLILGAVIWQARGCDETTPVAAPMTPAAAPAAPVGKPMELGPLEAFRAEGGAAQGTNETALLYVLEQVRGGNVRRRPDSILSVGEVAALDPKVAVGTSIETRGVVKSLDREELKSKIGVDRLWIFSLDDGAGHRVLVAHGGSSNDPEEGKPGDAFRGTSTDRLREGDTVLVRAIYLQQRLSGTAGAIAVDGPTALLVGREYRKAPTFPPTPIAGLADADWHGVRDRDNADTKTLEDDAALQTLRWARAKGHDAIVRDIESKAILTRPFDKDAFMRWYDELNGDKKHDKPDPRAWTNAAKGKVFLLTGNWLPDRSVLADWDAFPPNAFDVHDRWTMWFLSDNYLYAGLRMDSAFSPGSFPGVGDADRQRVLMYGVFVKNYTYFENVVDPQTKQPKEVTIPYFLLLHMEPFVGYVSSPLYKNAFFWVMVSLGVFGILFFAVLIRSEKKESAKSDAQRLSIRQRVRASGSPSSPEAAGGTGSAPNDEGGGGPAPGAGPPP